MSPGTSWEADTVSFRPPRRTTAVLGKRADSARTALSARYSCAKLKAPFTTITTMIADPSWGMPPTNARAAATQSMRAKK